MIQNILLKQLINKALIIASSLGIGSLGTISGLHSIEHKLTNPTNTFGISHTKSDPNDPHRLNWANLGTYNINNLGAFPNIIHIHFDPTCNPIAATKGFDQEIDQTINFWNWNTPPTQKINKKVSTISPGEHARFWGINGKTMNLTPIPSGPTSFELSFDPQSNSLTLNLLCAPSQDYPWLFIPNNFPVDGSITFNPNVPGEHLSVSIPLNTSSNNDPFDISSTITNTYKNDKEHFPNGQTSWKRSSSGHTYGPPKIDMGGGLFLGQDSEGSVLNTGWPNNLKRGTGSFYDEHFQDDIYKGQSEKKAQDQNTYNPDKTPLSYDKSKASNANLLGDNTGESTSSEANQDVYIKLLSEYFWARFLDQYFPNCQYNKEVPLGPDDSAQSKTNKDLADDADKFIPHLHFNYWMMREYQRQTSNFKWNKLVTTLLTCAEVLASTGSGDEFAAAAGAINLGFDIADMLPNAEEIVQGFILNTTLIGDTMTDYVWPLINTAIIQPYKKNHQQKLPENMKLTNFQFFTPNNSFWFNIGSNPSTGYYYDGTDIQHIKFYLNLTFNLS